MIDWPEILIKDIARRRCALYLGSGVSANAVNRDGKHPATWDEFLRNILNSGFDATTSIYATIEGFLQRRDYLMACELIVNEIGTRELGDFAANEYRRPGYLPAKIHDAIFGLDSRIVITPNIDKIYEQCAVTNGQGSVVVKKYWDDIAPFLRTEDYIIIKAHGCVDDTNRIVFTHEQYNIARYQHPAFYKILDALLLTNTFIFIGCGISDPDIQLTLENSNFSYPNCCPHYFVTSEGSIYPEVATSLLRNRNIKVLQYSNASGTHAELEAELVNLSSQVDIMRKDYSSKCTW